MPDDMNLKTAVDYSKGQKEAAYAVLGEIVNLLAPFSDDVRIVGGWVPSLLFPEHDHIGSIDVDVLLNQLNIKRINGYATIKKLLTNSGYRRHTDPHKYYTFVKTVQIDRIAYDVEVDFLSGKYGGEDGNVSKHVDGIKTLPATGGNFAFDFPANDIEIEYQRPDGALDFGHVKVISVLPYIVMKTAAMGRGKTKDAYDVYYCLRYFDGGIRALAKLFAEYKDSQIVQETAKKLSEKFASPQHAGPSGIVSFLGLTDEEETEQIRQDAYQRVRVLLAQLKS